MIKFIKPFYPLMLGAILLLFVQAICDLNLPNYMSRIVNVGIQQYGVENAAPDVISEQGLEFITSVMPSDEKAGFLAGYEKFEGSSTREVKISYGKLNSEYTGELYVLRQGVDIVRFNALFSRASNVVKTQVEKLGSGENALVGGNTASLDVKTLYAIAPMLNAMDEAEIVSEWDRIGRQPDLLTAQTGVIFTRMFYAELGADFTAIQRAYIIRIGLYMLGVALLGGGMTVLFGYISSLIGSGITRKLRNAFFEKVESFTSNEMDKFSTASLITRCTSDIVQIRMIFSMGIRMIFYSPIMAIGGVIMALGKSTSMSWIIALACAVLISIIALLLSRATPKFRIIQILVDKLNLVTREGLAGLMVVRAFGTEKHEEERFDRANTELAGTNLYVQRIMARLMPSMMLVMHGVQVLVMWVGASQIAASSLQVGDMMAFIQYLTQILMSFLMMSMMFFMIPRSIVAMNRINEVLNTEPSIHDPVTSKGFDPEKRGYVEFRNVGFRYEQAEYNALSDISFTAKPGKTTAIIGSTGSGKSTLANLILRFFDVTEGQILVNGTDVREVTQKELRSSIGYVPQRGVLISGTIATNIAYGAPDITDEGIAEAVRIAQATEFIAERQDGLDSEISQGGSNVSGGQRQRLAIARALATEADVFIFDDSFSALDFKTDAALRRELNAHVSNATVIVVAQRVSTIMNADEILVLDEGKIVGRGTHRELVQSCPQYHEIASSQMEKEEIA